MPTFAFEAINNAGKKTTGSIEAGSAEEAIKKVRAQGLFPSGVKEQKISGSGGAVAKKVRDTKKKKKGFNFVIGGVSTKKLCLFTRQLSTLQDAGLPLLRSLQILYTKMVAAGEVGGVLDVILQRLADFMEKGQRLKRRIIGALIYPTVVIFIAVLIVTGIMYFVIPKFQEIFEDFDVELPKLTLMMIDISKWIAGTSSKDQVVPGVIWVLASPVLIFLFFKLVRKTEPGRAITDIVILRVPVLGTMLRKTAIARFTRTLGTLISAGVPILEAIIITRDTSGNYVFEKALTKVHDSIREGETFAGPLRESKVCDLIVVNMIDVGEETGDLDVMLMKIADNYDEEVDVAVASLLSLLEPFMVVVLGGIVLMIVLALFLPLVSMIESVSNTSKK